MTDLRLFATDMDGTFLRSDRTFDMPRLTRAVRRLTASGKLFCAASGRSLPTLEAIFAPVKNDIAIVAENGCVVSCRGEVLFTVKIPDSQLDSLVEALTAMGQRDFLISGLRGAYALPGVSDSYFAHACLFYENVLKVDDWHTVDDEMLKITTNFESERVEANSRELERLIPGLRCTTTGFTSIDILPDGLSKATGLAHLAALEHLTADNVVAFGDQMNDYEMLDWAGTAVAVDNAVPEIKGIADYVIASNEEDAVLTEIERLL